MLLSFEDRLTSKDSLRSVTSLIRFSQTGSGEGTDATAARIMEALGKEFPRKRIGHVDTTGIEVAVPLSFAVKESTAPGYVNFIESAAKSRSQLLYSPAKDADVEEKFIRLRPGLVDGHLYLSAIPLRYLSADDPLLKKVSQTLVRTEEKQPSVLRLCDGRLEFRDINEKI